MNFKKKSLKEIVLILCALYLVVNLAYPVILVVSQAFDFEDGFASVFYYIFKVFEGKASWIATQNSIVSTTLATILAVCLAYFYAYFVEVKLSGKMKVACYFLAILPMLIPSIAHGSALVYLLGNQGIITNILGVPFELYGLNGIVLGSFMYAFPAAFMILSLSFSQMDQRIFELAKVYGTSSFQRMKDIILPNTKFAIFSAFVVVFAMVFTDYGVPIAVGGNYMVLPTLLYQNVIGLQNFNFGAVISLILLVPAVLSFLLDTFIFNKKQEQISRQNKRELEAERSGWVTKMLFVIVTIIIVAPMIVICIAPFIQGWPYNFAPTFEHFIKVFNTNGLLTLINNSLFMSLTTALVGTIFAFGMAYMINRTGLKKSIGEKMVNFLLLISLSVPGLVLGIGFNFAFRGTFLMGTFAILILVNLIHFIGSPYLMATNHVKRLNPNLEAINMTLGGKWYHSFFNIIIPNSKRTLIDMFTYFFVNSMITISAVSLLYVSSTRTLAIQITAFNDIADTEGAIAMAFVILLINIVMKLLQQRGLKEKNI